MNADKVLKQMLLSEKSSKLSSELGQYTFEVFRYANKHAIAEVTVRRVNVQNYPGKNKKSRAGRPSMTSDFKKAIVTLKAGDKIELV